MTIYWPRNGEASALNWRSVLPFRISFAALLQSRILIAKTKHREASLLPYLTEIWFGLLTLKK
jgi:hypothetical protein